MMKNNNDLDYIRLLLEKYYNADTTCDEEEILRVFFSETNAPDIPKDM